MKCVNHADRDSIAMCSICGRGICGECDIKLVGKYYCQKCADELVKEGAVIALRKLYEILQEKRKHHRVYILSPIEIVPSGVENMFYKGIIHNISSGGMAILCDKEIGMNEIVYLNFKLPNGIILEGVQGGVVRTERIGDKYNLGVLFMNMLEKQEIIDNFILDIKKKRYAADGVDITNYVL